MRCSGSSGWRSSCSCDDPWQVVLTTDHPNGGPFTSYPHLIRLLMDRSFRDEQLAKLHPDVAARLCVALDHARADARRDRGDDPRRARRGCSACTIAASSASVPRPTSRSTASTPTARRCSATPEYVFKDGVLVARAGRMTATPVGGTHFVEPDYDRVIEKTLRRHWDAHGSMRFDHVPIGNDELCRCCNGGRLLPTACFEAAG